VRHLPARVLTATDLTMMEWTCGDGRLAAHTPTWMVARAAYPTSTSRKHHSRHATALAHVKTCRPTSR
jgi:hypothetical protein